MQVIVIDFEGLWHKQSKKYYFQEFAFSDVKSVEAINFFIKRPNDVDITNFEYNERYGNQSLFYIMKNIKIAHLTELIEL
jgi:hypothetical protein